MPELGATVDALWRIEGALAHGRGQTQGHRWLATSYASSSRPATPSSPVKRSLRIVGSLSTEEIARLLLLPVSTLATN